MQSRYLTGRPPAEHGIVGTGWYFADEGEIRFWPQSNRLVQREPLWTIFPSRITNVSAPSCTSPTRDFLIVAGPR